MICNIHFEIQGKESIKSILNCGLSFKNIITKRNSFYTSSFGGWMRTSERPVFIVEVFPDSQIARVKGNIHYYFNNGEHNANDFHFEDLSKCINEICETLHITAEKAILRGFEFGVNISPFFNLKQFFNNLLCLKTAIAKKDEKSAFDLYRFNFSQYNLKVYHKSRMFNLENDILRVELHIDKMQWIQKQIPKLTTLYDLQDKEIMKLLGDILYKMVEEILINEDLNKTLMSQKDLKNWNKINNLNFWINITPDQRRNQKVHFYELVEKYGKSHYMQDLKELVSHKLNLLLDNDYMILPSGTSLLSNRQHPIDINNSMVLATGNYQRIGCNHHDFTVWNNGKDTMNLPLMLKGKG